MLSVPIVIILSTTVLSNLMRVGILDIQGAVSEHRDAFERAFDSLGISGQAYTVKKADDLKKIDGLVLPGGESSTISAQLERLEMDAIIIKLVEGGMPIMGTCAGTILLASGLKSSAEGDKAKPLGLMDIVVERNAFGRQRESFEMDIDIDGLDEKYRAVFIRAPIITGIGDNVVQLSRLENGTIMASEDNMLAMVFHPELTPDTRVHEMFIEMI